MAPPKARSPTRDNGIYSKLLRLYHLNPHTGDYIGLLLLLLAYTILQALTDPFHRLFRLDDPRLQFPHAEHERVPVPYLFLYAGGVPLLVLVLWTVLLRPGNHKTHVTLLGLAITILLTSFITDIMKDAIGRPRPDLIARYVITGSWIGMIVAYINWRRYYPGLLSQGCEEPHPCTPLGGKDGVNGFQRVRDEEEGYGSAGERFSVEDDRIEGYSRDATAR
ncbi:hypothetical protein LTR56_012326 [Elasticomyces elasticus]|nr:hypothetical protein LTR56_012326 [Elasticomyces elasticus]KAK3641282.1 hypothetical protein LTR22_016650 [Elasticomyces elasticus]KAK4922611.1 hypothetical protein LTR49_010138 [Elasticomyces elasticus]KAK5760784.1 hypothetical protein LTS12_009142 [Elasticomyces elasticus]